MISSLPLSCRILWFPYQLPACALSVTSMLWSALGCPWLWKRVTGSVSLEGRML